MRDVTVEHRITAADGVRIALHRIAPSGVPRGVPIVLTAGTFSSRLFWLGAKGQGFGYTLARAGFEAWVMEPRGHGSSDRPATWTLEEWIRLDAPAAVAAVRRMSGHDRVLWVGHSAGGVVGAAFAGSGADQADQLHGLVLLGSPGPARLGGMRRLGALGVFAAAAVFPGVQWQGRSFGLGPEHEPGTLVRQWMQWNISGRWSDSTGRDYLAGLRHFQAPILAVAGSGDRVLAPPSAVQDLLRRFGSRDQTLIVAGREHGYSVDYGHPSLIIGSPAKAEIWPRLMEWIESRT